MKLAQELINLGQQLANENEAASDLWSWLPSHKIAEKHHGDYADTHCPSNWDVMVEAAMYLAYLKHRSDASLTPEEQEWFSRCPCGEDHAEGTSTACVHCGDELQPGDLLDRCMNGTLCASRRQFHPSAVLVFHPEEDGGDGLYHLATGTDDVCLCGEPHRRVNGGRPAIPVNDPQLGFKPPEAFCTAATNAIASAAPIRWNTNTGEIPSREGAHFRVLAKDVNSITEFVYVVAKDSDGHPILSTDGTPEGELPLHLVIAWRSE